MRIYVVNIAAALVLVISTPSVLADRIAKANHTANEAPAVAQRWAHDRGRSIWSVHVAPDGSCIAVATAQGLAVLEKTGKPVWERAWVNRWLSAEVGAIAVSPGCHWLAVAGSSGYRHVWFLGPGGRSYAHARITHGTPTALTINHRGDTLAVGTGAGHLLLMDAQGAIRKDITFGHRIDGLKYSADDALLLTTRGMAPAGLLNADGVPLWTRDLGVWITVYPTDDWSSFLVVGEPGHGSDLASLEVVTRAGKTTWERQVVGPKIEMSPDGHSFVVATDYGPEKLEDPEERKYYMERTIVDGAGRETAAPTQRLP
jgi:hypothetical protein